MSVNLAVPNRPGAAPDALWEMCNMFTLKSKIVPAIVLCLALWPLSAQAQRAEWEQHKRLGTVAFEEGDYVEAEKQLESALRIAREHFRPVDERLAETLYLMGTLYGETDRNEQALPLLEQAVAMGEISLGEDSVKYSYFIRNLAAAYEALARFEDAMQSYLRSLKILERNFGSEDPQLTVPLEKVALLLSRQERHGEATQYYGRTAQINEKSFGPNHPIVAENLNDLADSLQSQKKFDEAISLHDRVLAIRRRSFGPDHYLVAESLEGYAMALRGAGRDGEAGKMEAQARSMRGGETESSSGDLKRDDLLLLSPSFQRLASQQGSPSENVRITCECYDRPQRTRRATVPMNASGGWDCPKGWSAACRIDQAMQGGVFWFTRGEMFAEKGSSPVSQYKIGTFRGEFVEDGKGFPRPGYLK